MSRALYAFVTPDRKFVSESQYEDLLEELDTNPKTFRNFDNGSVHVTLRFDGRLAGRMVTSMHSEHWQLWEVSVQNILTTDGEGIPYDKPKFVNDPDATQRFRTLDAATDYYESFLVQYGKCFGIVDEGGKVTGFKERNNRYSDIPNDEVVLGDGVESAETTYGSW